MLCMSIAEKRCWALENTRFERASVGDIVVVFALYRPLIHAPYSTWSEEYPTIQDVRRDVTNGWTIVMRDQAGRILAAIALLPGEEEPEFEEIAPWNQSVRRWACPSRLGVTMDMQGKGLARRMLSAAMEAAKEGGCDGVRFLVAKSNPIAQKAYSKLGFDVCGEHEMWGHTWLCYQKRL